MNQTIIDVREPNEYSSGHVQEALNIPLSQLQQSTSQLSDLPKDTSIVVYCRSGGRSSSAMGILSQLGYTDVTNGINQQQVEASRG